MSPVVMAYGGATVVLAVALRGERLEPLQWLGAALATVGIILVGTRAERGAWRRHLVGVGVGMALLTVLAFSIFSVASAGPVRSDGWLGVVVGSRASSALVAVLGLAVVRRARRPSFDVLLEPDGPLDRPALGLLLACGALDIAAYAAFAIAIGIAPVWLVGLTSSFGPAVAVLYAVARLRERLQVAQWLGLGILGAGAAVLAVTAGG